MPNWVSNEFYVEAEKSTKSRKQLKDFIKDSVIEKDDKDYTGKPIKTYHLSFEGIVPMPKTEKDNWYNWRCENWGTKWDACDSDIYDEDSDYICINFNTAWSPPTFWMLAATKKYPLLDFSNKVDEEGNFFAGWVLAKKGRVQENLATPNWR